MTKKFEGDKKIERTKKRVNCKTTQGPQIRQLRR